ncbi:hypothetical protein Nepgr_016889 [Nepenthes gracilis]|uniref:Uncharacterized protein n=1 Tax=Nepenthes gracilis TaxID=150966 RepID=A0AAD3SNF3_NEPGR|nr:hypothetical protein Nepgr_016889 [Nepenthes gracilis]
MERKFTFIHTIATGAVFSALSFWYGSCLDENQLVKSSVVSLRTFAALIQVPHLPLSLIKIDPNFVVEQAARESSQTKQDWYAEMWRRRDEEHEAKERQLLDDFSSWSRDEDSTAAK